MTIEIISRSISTKVWGRAGIELVTPGSAIRASTGPVMTSYFMATKFLCEITLFEPHSVLKILIVQAKRKGSDKHG